MLEIINIQSSSFNQWRIETKELLRVSISTSFPNTYIDESYYDTKCKELEQYLLNKQATVFLAVSDTMAQGFVWVHPYYSFGELRLHISHFAVFPQYRRQGVGMSLYYAVVKYAQSQGIAVLELLVSSSDSSAVEFYNKCGFQVERYQMKRQI